MVTDTAIWEAVGEVADPEVPVLTIADLGVLRDVRHEVELTLDSLHLKGRVETVLSPAWTTDWMSESGKAKLIEYGIAPPTGHRAVGGPVSVSLTIRCPLCGSPDTSELSRFGSTSCKSLWRCNSCREPFDHFKAI